MKKLVALVIAVVFASGLFLPTTGCATKTVVVTSKPPVAKAEVRPVKPGPRHVWVRGHWAWKTGRYVWIPGHWVKPKPGHVWVDGHWKHRGAGWVWVPGHWQRG